jgi:SsrA-binding protein
MPSFATNRDALHKYNILEKLEAGIVLTGAEVKSVKGGNVSLKGSYATIQNGQLMLLNMHIGHYKPAGINQKIDTDRSRHLLVRREEIDRFVGHIHSAGLTLVPLSVYSKNGLVKIELGLGRGKKAYDKRASIKKREVDRKIGRAMRMKA